MPAFSGHDENCMTTSPNLPIELKAALDARLVGLSRRDATGRAARISENYRSGGNSGTIRSQADALAYALARMPATYAAVIASLKAFVEIKPDFTPQSLLDVGAGPGTATWAAAEVWPSLDRFALLDANAALRDLALELARDNSRLRAMDYRFGDAHAALANAETADLVIASYVMGEMNDAGQRELAKLLWRKTRDTLLVVEPGTPQGYARIIALRERLIASGARVAAPCPHDGRCPLRQPDWCHFARRLPRLQAHMQIKDAELPFEDEKFSYVALTHAPVAGRPARLLAQPVVGKVEISAKLCSPDGLTLVRVPRRTKAAYARARRWRWGDAVSSES
jgi:ribosomal protein RSM22 (predicted rRNA methylase)